MATIRERGKGVWEIRVFTGRDEKGRPTQISRTVRGSKRDAQRVAAELTIKPSPKATNRTVADALDAWVEANLPTWAPNSARDQQSRAALIKADQIAARRVARLSVDEVEHWHTRMRHEGVGEQAIRNRHMVLRASLAQAMRWGWITSNPAALAKLTQPKTAPRGAMTPDEVRRVTRGRARHRSRGRARASSGRDDRGAARRASGAAVDRPRRRSPHDRARDRHRPERGAPWRPGPAGRADQDREPPGRDARPLDHRALAHALEAERSAAGAGPWLFALDVDPPNPDRIGYWWREARRRSGIATKWRLHDLRHWSATFAIGGGHDVRTVAGRLGHANAAITLKTYAACDRRGRRGGGVDARLRPRRERTVSQPTVAGSTLFSMSSVELDENLLAAAQREADRRGVDVSVVVGEAVQRFVVGADLRQLLDEFRRRDAESSEALDEAAAPRGRERRAGRRARGSSLTEDAGEAGVWQGERCGDPRPGPRAGSGKARSWAK